MATLDYYKKYYISKKIKMFLKKTGKKGKMIKKYMKKIGLSCLTC